jgi:thiol-disulfide isomerase/thioredoxin
MSASLVACKEQSLRNTYKITGKVSSDSMNGKTIYLENYLWYIELSDKKTLDSAIIQNRKFEFKGVVEMPYMALITSENRSLTNFFVENGNIKVDIYDDPTQTVVSGTSLNNQLKSYNDKMIPIRSKLTELMQYAQSQERTDEIQNEIETKYQELSKDIEQTTTEFLNKNPTTIFSAYLLLNLMSNGIDEETIKTSYEKFDEKVKNSELGNIILSEIKKMTVKEITAGETFRDLTLKTPDDKDISISDFIGKSNYVLLDFWASWCGPCRSENPGVVALYKEYKDKGFEIVGISLDNNKTAWINGIKNDNITWPQMSDLKGWDSEAALTYSIKSIPFTVLFDKEGKVIETNLRGDALRNKIKTLIP